VLVTRCDQRLPAFFFDAGAVLAMPCALQCAYRRAPKAFDGCHRPPFRFSPRPRGKSVSKCRYRVKRYVTLATPKAITGVSSPADAFSG